MSRLDLLLQQNNAEQTAQPTQQINQAPQNSRLDLLLNQQSTQPTQPINQTPTNSRLDLLLGQQPIQPQQQIETPSLTRSVPGTLETLAELQVDPLSLKQNPLNAISAVWENLKGAVKNEAQNIKELFSAKRPTEAIGKGLETIAGAGGVVFSPITALFEGANKIPVLGSISRLIGLPFVATGEITSDVLGKVVDKLPISEQAKQDIKPGIQEIAALASQIALGKVAQVGEKKFAELTKKFGPEDAITIVDQAHRLANQAKEPIPQPLAEQLSRVKTEKPAEATPIAETIKPIEKVKGVPKEPESLAQEVVKPAALPEEVKPAKPSKQFIEVPREQLPVKTEGAEKGVSALEARIKGIVNDDNVKLAKAEAKEKGLDISIYDKMNKADQIRKAAEYVEKNPQYKVLEILKGNEPEPKGILRNALMIALEQKSLREKNIDLAVKLASLRSTRMGQEISILTEIQGDNPISGLDAIIRARREAVERKLKPGEKIETRKQTLMDEATKETNRFKLKLEEVNKLLESIVCK